MPKFLIRIIVYKHIEENRRTKKYVPQTVPINHAIEKGPTHSFEIQSRVPITPLVYTSGPSWLDGQHKADIWSLVFLCIIEKNITDVFISVINIRFLLYQ